MGNLGPYQDMTTMAKKVGGPRTWQFSLSVAGGWCFEPLRVVGRRRQGNTGCA